MTYRDEALRQHADRVQGVTPTTPDPLTAAVQHEREACAQIADGFVHGDGFPSQAGEAIAKAIRART